jgi:hypothetical protein
LFIVERTVKHDFAFGAGGVVSCRSKAELDKIETTKRTESERIIANLDR